MDYEEIYEEILPYLSEPSGVKEFLDKNKEKNIDLLVEELNKLIVESNAPFKTDLRILLNALHKRR